MTNALTREELETELARWRKLAEGLAIQLERMRKQLAQNREEMDMLRSQNDLLQELLEEERKPDTIPAASLPFKPALASERIKTQPSSPNAIRVEDVLAAIEAQEFADEIDD